MLNISALLKKSGANSSLLPDILSESSILTRNVLQGLHSTRFPGKGEAFWQFKEYRQGDSIGSIDWRKSASSNKFLVREKENETSKVIYFYYDTSKSMNFKSSNFLKNKYYMAALITLTLSRIFLRNSENVYLFNDKKVPVKCLHGLNNFDQAFLQESQNNDFPNEVFFKSNSLVVILSDFFFNNDSIKNFIYKLKKKNISGYLVHVLDPLEINFQVGANVQLNDLETDKSLLVGDSVLLSEKYADSLNKLVLELKSIAEENSWNYMLYNTEESLNDFLLKLIKNILLKKNKIA
ncbi:DUF58 domain-containing protein [Alphaproteobacteria bacterium]|nr:DUF58 domain-containing protein [Alphaproteobacteria bacterium]